MLDISYLTCILSFELAVLLTKFMCSFIELYFLWCFRKGEKYFIWKQAWSTTIFWCRMEKKSSLVVYVTESLLILFAHPSFRTLDICIISVLNYSSLASKKASHGLSGVLPFFFWTCLCFIYHYVFHNGILYLRFQIPSRTLHLLAFRVPIPKPLVGWSLLTVPVTYT